MRPLAAPTCLQLILVVLLGAGPSGCGQSDGGSTTTSGGRTGSPSAGGRGEGSGGASSSGGTTTTAGSSGSGGRASSGGATGTGSSTTMTGGAAGRGGRGGSGGGTDAAAGGRDAGPDLRSGSGGVVRDGAMTGGSTGALGTGGTIAGGAGGTKIDAGGTANGVDGGAAGLGPCDIYASGNTPCVAAHSMVRALYGAYAGRLYQVQRASDSKTQDVATLAAGGFADAAAQDAFCKGTTCTVSIIYDQSPKANHLTPAPGGGAVKTPDKPVNAAKLKLTVGGHTVYGAYFEGGMGYRNNKTSGMATGDQPESMYMVASGKHYNDQCCWDYGNAETTNNDDGEGTMEAIYFGDCDFWGKGSASGPWIMADIENGLWAGNVTPNNSNTPMSSEYITAMVKGKPHTFAIKGGDATSGSLKTMWEGAYPAKGATGQPYDPMRKQGAIILGIGGDNSNGGVGTFFEGCIASGYSSNETDNAIQANIIAAGYGH